MKTYPINLVGLKNERCLVIGGGAVAEGKVMGLITAGARPIIISPAITPNLAALAAAGRVEYRSRAVCPQDVAGAFLVIVATDDPELNRQVWPAARQQGALVNVVDAPPLCNFYAPAVVRRGDFVLTVSTGGAAPALAARTRQELEARFGPEYETLVAWCAAIRPAVLNVDPNPAERKERWYALVDSPVLSLLANGRTAAARAWVAKIMGEEIATFLPSAVGEASHE